MRSLAGVVKALRLCEVVHEGLHSVCKNMPHRSNVQELTHSGGAFLTVRALGR